MVTKIKIKTIELEFSANVVAPGDSVRLTANLSDREWDELGFKGGEITFSVDGNNLQLDRMIRDRPLGQPPPCRPPEAVNRPH
jgi:hypothetical protein